MFIGSNIIFIYGNSVKIARIGNLRFLINGEGGKISKFDKRGGPNKSVEGGKISRN